MANTIATALVQSRLDYVNSILYLTSNTNLTKLQRIQNTAARIVTHGSNTNFSSAQALSKLHWLPVRHRINFKIATLTYKALYYGQPIYLKSCLTSYTPLRNLRSSDQFLLTQPRVSSLNGSRSFSSAAPTVWNSIPLFIRSSDSFHTFKKRLKTFYFNNLP